MDILKGENLLNELTEERITGKRGRGKPRIVILDGIVDC